MLGRLYSFKFIIGLALLWLGTLAYGLAIYSTQVYREHAITMQVESLETMLELESGQLIRELYDQQKQFALGLQNEEPFQRALRERDSAALVSWLNESYARYQVASGQFRSKAIIVRDLSGEIFAQSSDDGSNSYGGCPTALESIGGALMRLVKPKNVLCSFDGQLFSEVLLPVGGLEPEAYLHVVAYAVEGLKSIETDLSLPISIDNGSGSSLYLSPDWVEPGNGGYLYPVYKLWGDDAFLGATISASFDQQPLIDRLGKTETSFFIITTIATVTALIIVLLLLNRAFMPMNKLRNSVGALLTGKYASISEDKLPSELKDLVVAYNEMVEGLEIETISRRQIEEKLRSE